MEERSGSMHYGVHPDPGPGVGREDVPFQVLPGGPEIPAVMWTVFAALMPAAGVGFFYFGRRALVVLLASTAGCVLLETLFLWALHRRAGVRGGGAAVTGLMLGMILPPGVSLGLVIVGCVSAILLRNIVFFGWRLTPFTPALAARVFLMIVFAAPMTTWTPPTPFFAEAPDAVTAATPLGQVRMEIMVKGTALAAKGVSLLDTFLGRIPGSVGETSAAALLLGGLYLLGRRVISWHIPLSFLGTVAILSGAFSAVAPDRFLGPAFQLTTGGLLLGALFVAVDYECTAVTRRGRVVFGAGCGLLTFLLRSFGSCPEGVASAILLMTMMMPLIDLYTQPQVAGGPEPAEG